MTERVALLVTASREWADYGPIRERLKLYPEGTILIHGDNGHFEKNKDPMKHDRLVGGDRIAADIGQSLGFVPWALPYFGDLKKQGGPVRNACMFELLLVLQKYGHRCACEAFPIHATGGTRRVIEKVEAHNKRYNNPTFRERCVALHVTEGA